MDELTDQRRDFSGLNTAPVEQDGDGVFATRGASFRQSTTVGSFMFHERARIREQHRLSLQSYGRPRMTEELQELGVNVGHRRIGRLMRENGIKIIRTRKYKVTTIARQAIAKQSAERGTAITRLTSPPTCWTRISPLLAQTRNGQATYPISGPVKAGCIWQ